MDSNGHNFAGCELVGLMKIYKKAYANNLRNNTLSFFSFIIERITMSPITSYCKHLSILAMMPVSHKTMFGAKNKFSILQQSKALHKSIFTKTINSFLQSLSIFETTLSYLPRSLKSFHQRQIIS